MIFDTEAEKKVDDSKGSLSGDTIYDLGVRVQDLSSRVEVAEKKTDVFNEKLDQREIRTTEVLAIFVTLFTFISVNVTIFTKLDNLQTAVYFMLLMTVCSITLLSFMFIIINGGKKSLFSWVVLLSCLGILLFLLLVGMKSSNWDLKLRENNDSQIPIQKIK